METHDIRRDSCRYESMTAFQPSPLMARRVGGVGKEGTGIKSILESVSRSLVCHIWGEGGQGTQSIRLITPEL